MKPIYLYLSMAVTFSLLACTSSRSVYQLNDDDAYISSSSTPNQLTPTVNLQQLNEQYPSRVSEGTYDYRASDNQINPNIQRNYTPNNNYSSNYYSDSSNRYVDQSQYTTSYNRNTTPQGNGNSNCTNCTNNYFNNGYSNYPYNNYGYSNYGYGFNRWNYSPGLSFGLGWNNRFGFNYGFGYNSFYGWPYSSFGMGYNYGYYDPYWSYYRPFSYYNPWSYGYYYPYSYGYYNSPYYPSVYIPSDHTNGGVKHITSPRESASGSSVPPRGNMVGSGPSNPANQPSTINNNAAELGRNNPIRDMQNNSNPIDNNIRPNTQGSSPRDNQPNATTSPSDSRVNVPGYGNGASLRQNDNGSYQYSPPNNWDRSAQQNVQPEQRQANPNEYSRPNNTYQPQQVSPDNNNRGGFFQRNDSYSNPSSGNNSGTYQASPRSSWGGGGGFGGGSGGGSGGSFGGGGGGSGGGGGGGGRVGSRPR